MSSSIGKNYTVDVFGESHSAAIGVVIGGVPAGTEIDRGRINAFLERRRPSAGVHSTARRETDEIEILSGVLDGRATGAPLAAIIRNADTRSSDYGLLKSVMRPSHSDYAASVKYGGYNDYRGGGQFSGRLTAPLCIAGSIALDLLQKRGIEVTAYLAAIGSVHAPSYKEYGAKVADILTETKREELRLSALPFLDASYTKAAEDEIKAARSAGDSVGGIIECVVTGLPVGVGEPLYDSLEGVLSKVLFSIPAVKGVEFGSGFNIAEMRGSVANDRMYFESGAVKTRTNHNGGITGGISNGMPVTFRVAVKPVPSIAIEQDTVDIAAKKDTKLAIGGRHDACIAPRAVPVIEAAAACVLYDLM
ncbi:MAG: chorismate synthase [Clostridiales bacterium]|jgi:chorismate synthase|nr:chorismate synthase [Clostridiales bacterium]